MRGAAGACAFAALLGVAAAHAGTQATVYDNTVSFGAAYYAGQAGEEALDDLHCTSIGVLTSCAFRYYCPDPSGTFSATVTIYNNPGGADVSATAIAGPFTVNNLAVGSGLATVPIANGPLAGKDLWMGVKFSRATAGLLVSDVPAKGTSHDYYMENGALYGFGTAAKANFCLRVDAYTGVLGVDAPGGSALALAPVRPNPARSSAEFAYTLPVAGAVRLAIVDAGGRTVRVLAGGAAAAGTHALRWDGRDDAGRAVHAGVYWARLTSTGGTRARPFVLVP